MTATIDLRPQLAGAAEWRLLSLLLSRPRPGWREEVQASAGEVGEDVARAAAEAPGASEGAYHALLGPGGPASPREAAHAGFVDPGRILADLDATYEVFGFRNTAEEADDHLAVECDFVAYLFLKEAFALASGAAERADIARAARARFVAEHVAIAGHGLAGKLPPHAPAYLALAARALSQRLPEAPPRPAQLPCEDPLEGGRPAECRPG